MQFRMLVPTAMIALSGIASAQATAPAAEPATPATAATESTPAPAPAVPAVEAAQPVAAASAAEKPKQRCHKEYPTGSNLPKTVCDTERNSADEAARANAMEELKHTVRSPARNPGGGG